MVCDDLVRGLSLVYQVGNKSVLFEQLFFSHVNASSVAGKKLAVFAVSKTGIIDISAAMDRQGFFIFSVLHNASQEVAGLNFLDRVPRYDLKPLHQCPVLFWCDLQCFFFCTGQLKPPSSSLL